MNYVYVLKSEKDGHLYIGQTNDIEYRVDRHSTGQVRSTRNRRPLQLIFLEKYDTRSEAIERESYLKSLKGGNEFKRILGSKAN